MKPFLTLCFCIVLLFLQNNLFAQCPGSVTFSSQAQLNSFNISYPACTQISGSVIITGADITDLTPLSAITSIGGHLNISNNPLLTNLTGLGAITAINGNLFVNNNNLLVNLNGLNALQSIGEDLQIFSNPVLSSLSGLNALTTVGAVIEIHNNALSNFTGLNSLAIVGQAFQIYDNSNLTSLNGLSSLTTINGALKITNNAVLTNIGSLGSLSTLSGSLSIGSNPALANLSGLSSLTSIGGYVSITSNAALSSLSGLNSLSTINGYLRLSSNNALTNISALSNLTSINGYLRINLNSHLTNLNGLLGLTSIAGELNLTSNVLLTNIDALENINPASINNLILQSNGTLALCEISSVCAYLNNPSNTATIASNASNCASRLAVENACLLVLPVELISFTAASSGTNVKLIWTTARELNNDHFEIERSADGIQFEIIGSVSGSNAKKTIRKYEYIDVNPHEIVNYYRLKQIDSNGKFQYSNIISAKIQSEKEIDVYPNPALNELIIANNTENSSYFIRNSIGQICQKGILHPDEVIDLSTIASGLYFLELEGKMIRFVKE